MSWLNQLYAQTPSDHPDKRLLLRAVELHRVAVTRAESVKRRNEIVQEVLGDRPASFLTTIFEDQDYNEDNFPDDANFADICERFHSDFSSLQILTRELKDYCGHVNDYCNRILVLPGTIELFISLQPDPHPVLESKWNHFGDSFRRLLKEYLFADSKVCRLRDPWLRVHRRTRIRRRVASSDVKWLTHHTDW